MMPYSIPAPTAAKKAGWRQRPVDAGRPMAALVELSALGFRFLPGHHPVGIDLDRAHPDVSLRGFAITGKKAELSA